MARVHVRPRRGYTSSTRSVMKVFDGGRRSHDPGAPGRSLRSPALGHTRALQDTPGSSSTMPGALSFAKRCAAVRCIAEFAPSPHPCRRRGLPLGPFGLMDLVGSTSRTRDESMTAIIRGPNTGPSFWPIRASRRVSRRSRAAAVTNTTEMNCAKWRARPPASMPSAVGRARSEIALFELGARPSSGPTRSGVLRARGADATTIARTRSRSGAHRVRRPLFVFSKRRTLMKTPVRDRSCSVRARLLASDGVPVSAINIRRLRRAARRGHIVNVVAISRDEIATPEDLDRASTRLRYPRPAPMGYALGAIASSPCWKRCRPLYPEPATARALLGGRRVLRIVVTWQEGK